MFSCTNIIVVMTTKASQWDSFHVELAMECHGGKRFLRHAELPVGCTMQLRGIAEAILIL